MEAFICALSGIIQLPFRIIWDIIVTGLIVGGFVLWFGFIFGSVVAVVLILAFKPDLFLLPLMLAVLYVPVWADCRD